MIRKADYWENQKTLKEMQKKKNIRKKQKELHDMALKTKLGHEYDKNYPKKQEVS